MKRNKKAIFISGMVLLAALLLIVYGIWGNVIKGMLFKKTPFVPSYAQDDNVGISFQLEILGDMVEIGEDNFYYTFFENPDSMDDDYCWCGVRKICYRLCG